MSTRVIFVPWGYYRFHEETLGAAFLRSVAGKNGVDVADFNFEYDADQERGRVFSGHDEVACFKVLH